MVSNIEPRSLRVKKHVNHLCKLSPNIKLFEKLKIYEKQGNDLRNNNQEEESIVQELNEKYLKIKEGLIRCGNIVTEISKKESINIIFSFLNSKKFFSKKEEKK